MQYFSPRRLLHALACRNACWPGPWQVEGATKRRSLTNCLSERANLKQTEPLATHSLLAFLCMWSADGIRHRWRRVVPAKHWHFLVPPSLLLLESIHTPHTQSELWRRLLVMFANIYLLPLSLVLIDRTAGLVRLISATPSIHQLR